MSADLEAAAIKGACNVANGLASKIFTATGVQLALDIKEAQGQGYRTILDLVVKDESIPYDERIAFVSSYDQTIKAERRKAKAFMGAVAHIKESSDPSEVDDDWLLDYFDKVSKVSDDSMQAIWSRVLGGKVNNPSEFSKSLLHLLFMLERKDADSFVNLSRFCFYRVGEDNAVHPAVLFGLKPSSYRKMGITDSSLSRLRSLGLVDLSYERGYTLGKEAVLQYGGSRIAVEGDSVNMGCVKLTEDGAALFGIIEKMNDDSVFDFTVTLLRRSGLSVTIVTGVNARSFVV